MFCPHLHTVKIHMEIEVQIWRRMQWGSWFPENEIYRPWTPEFLTYLSTRWDLQTRDRHSWSYRLWWPPDFPLAPAQGWHHDLKWNASIAVGCMAIRSLWLFSAFYIPISLSCNLCSVLIITSVTIAGFSLFIWWGQYNNRCKYVWRHVNMPD